MQSEEFFQICITKFDFLINRFDLRIIEKNIDSSGWEILMANNTTGIKILLEFKEMYVFISICQLVNGCFVFPAGEMKPTTKLYCYDLEDLVNLRSSELQKSDIHNNNFIEYLLVRHAKNLKTFAGDILLGSFIIFSDLEKIVKCRARAAAFDKWGEQAARFGWRKQ